MSTTSLPTQALKRMLGFPLRDAEARNKLFVAAALSLASMLVPLLPYFFLAGYAARLMRPIISEGAEAELPEWDDWGGLLKDGARLVFASLIWTLPGWLLTLVGYGVYMSPFVGMMIPGAGPSEPSVNSILVAYGFGWIGIIGGMLLLMALAVIQPIVLSHVAATGHLGKAFALRELWGVLRKNWGGWALVMLVLFGILAAGSSLIEILMLTGVLCCLTPFMWAAFLGWWVLVAAALSASAYREAMG